MLEVRLLGQFDVRRDGKPIVIASRSAQSLLAYLAINPNTKHRREKLAGLLWPDVSEANARRNLRQEFWRLRKFIGSSYFVADDLAIAFVPHADDQLDSSTLQNTHGRNDSAQGLMDALAVYQDELLPGFYEEWVVLERERLRALFEQQMQQLLACLVAEERWSDVFLWGERWIARGHSPEPAYRALMTAHAALGDMSRVASEYERCVSALGDDLGVEPSEQTRALYEQLKTRKPASPALPPAPQPGVQSIVANDDQLAALGEPPFKGLQPFDEADADNFFGRERLTAKLVAHLRLHALLVVVGPSGSGKSSLVRAGLIPALKRGERVMDGTLPPEGSARWPVHIITPTAHPLESLAISLTRQADSVAPTTNLMDDLARDPRSLHLHVRKQLAERERLLLVVDQFEELFTLCRDEAERRAFVDNLLNAVSADPGPVIVVICLRADFYAHCAQHAHLCEALEQQQAYIVPMNAEELRRAIEGPAERGDWEFEPGLVDLILRDVGNEPGALPLLSHALLETWQRRRGRTLTFAGYAACGGVRGAIAQTAERVYQNLSAAQQAIARNIFLRLTELGEGTEDTRRRASLSELIPSFADARAAEAVLKLLADARLVTVGENTAEVAHEALIREWPALRDWLNQDREGLRLHRHLTEAAQAWQRLNRDEGELYRGARLAQALEWAEAHAGELNPLEREFLDGSQARLEKEETEREAQRQRELAAAQQLAEAETRRAEDQVGANRRLRQRALFLVGALVLAALLAASSLVLAQQSNQNAARAEDERRTAFVRELSVNAVNNLGIDPERSILLALQAVAVSSTGGKPVLREAEEALHRALGASRLQLTLRGHTASVGSIAYSPDGKRLATASYDKTAKVWDALTGKELLTLSGHTDVVGLNDIAFNPDGTRIVTGSSDKTAKVWDAVTGKELLTLGGHTDQLWGVAFSPDGTRIATASFDKTAKVWDAVTGKEVLSLGGNNGGVCGVAFSPDGKRLVTGSWSDDTTHAARVWDAMTGNLLLTLTGHKNIIFSVTFSPDGKRIATSSGDTTARIWDSTTGQSLLTLYSGGYGAGVAFSPDGTRLATRQISAPAKVWDATTGQLLQALAGPGSYGVAYSPDGTHLAVGSDDTTAKVWDVSPAGGRDWLTLAGHSANARAVSYSADGTRLATASYDKTAKVWDSQTGKALLSLIGHTDFLEDVAFSPNGSRLATTSRDQTAKIWDASTGKQLLSIPTSSVPSGAPHHVAFSPDGRRVATASAGGTAKIWDTVTGKELLTLCCHTATVLGIAFSPDGTRLATSSLDSTAKVWDALTGKELLTLSGNTALLATIAYSYNGQRIVTGSQDGTAKVWDAASGQLLVTLVGHSGNIWDVAFSPDDAHLASVGADGTLKVWNVAAGATQGEQPLTLYNPVAQALNSVAYSPDGKRVAAASFDGTVPIFDLSLADTIAIAKSRVTRSLTTDECQTFLHVEQCPAGP